MAPRRPLESGNRIPDLVACCAVHASIHKVPGHACCSLRKIFAALRVDQTLPLSVGEVDGDDRRIMDGLQRED